MKNSCKKCGEELVEKVNRNTGQKFYGCINYPQCKYTKSYTDKKFNFKKYGLLIAIILAVPSCYWAIINIISEKKSALDIVQLASISSNTTLENVIPYRSIGRREFYVKSDSALLNVNDNKISYLISNSNEKRVYLSKIMMDCSVRRKLIKYNYPELYPRFQGGTELGGNLIYNIFLHGKDNQYTLYDVSKNDSVLFYNRNGKPDMIVYYMRSVPGYEYDIRAGFEYFTDKPSKKKIRWLAPTVLKYPLCLNWWDVFDTYVDTVNIQVNKLETISTILNGIFQEEYDGTCHINFLMNLSELRLETKKHIKSLRENPTRQDSIHIGNVSWHIKFLKELQYYDASLYIYMYNDQNDLDKNLIYEKLNRVIIFGDRAQLSVSSERDKDYECKQGTDYLPYKVIYSENTKVIIDSKNKFKENKARSTKVDVNQVLYYIFD